jgi:hypothetical protein
MMKDKPDKIIDIASAGAKADKRRHTRREARANDLKQRFASARRAAESKSKAAERLKKRFKKTPH